MKLQSLFPLGFGGHARNILALLLVQPIVLAGSSFAQDQPVTVTMK